MAVLYHALRTSASGFRAHAAERGTKREEDSLTRDRAPARELLRQV